MPKKTKITVDDLLGFEKGKIQIDETGMSAEGFSSGRIMQLMVQATANSLKWIVENHKCDDDCTIVEQSKAVLTALEGGIKKANEIKAKRDKKKNG